MSVWCEHCRDHYPESHYGEDGTHKIGSGYGPVGAQADELQALRAERDKAWAAVRDEAEQTCIALDERDALRREVAKQAAVLEIGGNVLVAQRDEAAGLLRELRSSAYFNKHPGSISFRVSNFLDRLDGEAT